MSFATSTEKSPPWWDWFLILIIAAVFGYAGVIKIRAIANFSHVVARFHVLPSVLINPVAMILPTVEILLAVLLLTPVLQRPALLGVVLCCIVFCLVVTSAIIEGIPVSCGCFGFTEKRSIQSPWWALGRDTILLGVSLFLYLRRFRTP